MSSLIDISPIKLFQMCQLNAEILITKKIRNTEKEELPRLFFPFVFPIQYYIKKIIESALNISLIYIVLLYLIYKNSSLPPWLVFILQALSPTGRAGGSCAASLLSLGLRSSGQRSWMSLLGSAGAPHCADYHRNHCYLHLSHLL